MLFEVHDQQNVTGLNNPL